MVSKITFTALISAYLTTVFTEVGARNLTVDDGIGIQWVGSIFPDQQPTTLYGTAEEIYRHIIKVNPNYTPADSSKAIEFPSEAFSLPQGSSEGRDLIAEARDVQFTKRNANRGACGSGTMATGNYLDIDEQGAFLRRIGGRCGVPGARDCRRMTCDNTSATYICSERNVGTSTTCHNAGSLVDGIMTACCQASKGVSGYLYMNNVGANKDKPNYSIWIGYGNCGHGSSSRPSRYPYPGGSPNGKCKNSDGSD